MPSQKYETEAPHLMAELDSAFNQWLGGLPSHRQSIPLGLLARML